MAFLRVVAITGFELLEEANHPGLAQFGSQGSQSVPPDLFKCHSHPLAPEAILQDFPSGRQVVLCGHLEVGALSQLARLHRLIRVRLLKSILPITGPTLAVREGDYPNSFVQVRVDDKVREPLYQVSACAIFAQRPAFRVFTYGLNGSLDFRLEVEPKPGASLFIPCHRFP